jgi:hypothetical protein
MRGDGQPACLCTPRMTANRPNNPGDQRKRVSATSWGSSGRRFKSCQPDAGQRPFLPLEFCFLGGLTHTFDPNQLGDAARTRLLARSGWLKRQFSAGICRCITAITWCQRAVTGALALRSDMTRTCTRSSTAFGARAGARYCSSACVCNGPASARASRGLFGQGERAVCVVSGKQEPQAGVADIKYWTLMRLKQVRVCAKCHGETLREPQTSFGMN